MNRVLNLSVLDGWRREGYNKFSGFAIGSEAISHDDSWQDNVDSESLYDILENSLIPLYYDRNDDGIPEN